jgi:CRP-like cAMP-binding protein
MSGKNIIFGAGEVLIHNRDKVEQFRSKDVYIYPGSVYEPLEENKLIQIFKSPKIAYAVTKTIAMSLMKVNKIFLERSKELSSSARLTQSYCKIYAAACDIILSEFNEKRYHWLEELFNETSRSLCYLKGKAFLQMDKMKVIKIDAKTDDLDKVYSHKTFICRQGEIGYDMFILREGKIDVVIGDDIVTQITEPGTVIGEIALLLGQERSANLIANGEVRLSVINKDNILNVIKSDPGFFLNIATTHSYWESNNCVLVRDIEDQISLQEKESHLPKFMKTENKYKENLYNLKRDVMNLNSKYNMAFLDKVEDAISAGLNGE